jgi:4-amino-4-deoxy-L-arabinose transferase-like glycosyltransferase
MGQVTTHTDDQHPRGPHLLPQIGISVFFAGFFLLLVLSRWHTYAEPFERDISTYLVVAREMLAGRYLYADLWDHKPPGIFLTYAAFIVLFGYGRLAVFFANMAAAGITLIGVYKAAAVTDRRTSIPLWAAAYWTIISGDLHLQANQPNVEVFINACLIWIFFLFVRLGTEKDKSDPLQSLWPWMAGVLIALASLYKQVAVVPVVCFSLIHVFWPPFAQLRRTSLVDMAKLWSVPLVAWLGAGAYFFMVRRFYPFYSAVVLFNGYYAGNLFHNLHQLFYVSTVVNKSVIILVVPLAMSIAVALGGLFTARKRICSFFLAYFLGAELAIVLPGHLHLHYYQILLPAVAIGCALVVSSLQALPIRASSLAAALGGVAFLSIFAATEIPNYRSPATRWSYEKYGSEFIDAEAVGEFLRQRLQPQETFYEWGWQPGLYFVTRKHPLTGVVNTRPLFIRSFRDSLAERLVTDLKSRSPDLIVVERHYPSAFFPTLALTHPAWLLRGYDPLYLEPFPDYTFFVRHRSDLQNRLPHGVVAK